MSGMRVISMDRETAFRRTTMRGPESLEVYVSKINSSTFLTLTSYLLSDVYSVEKGRSVIVKFIDGTTLELENRESSVADYKKLGSSTTQWYASHRITLSKEDAAAFRNKPIQKIRLYSSDGYDDFDIDPKNNQLLMYLCNCVEKG